MPPHVPIELDDSFLNPFVLSDPKLEALREATQGKLSYVFTSFREYELLTSSIFAATHYVKPALYQDADAILLAFAQRQHVTLSKEEIQLLLDTAGGHMQLLHNLLLALGALKKSREKHIAKNFSQLAITARACR